MATSPRISAGELWVHRIGLASEAAAVADAYELLSGSELQRAASYQSKQRADRFAVTRATLRRLLGEQLDMDPAMIPIRSPRHFKPHLDARTQPDLRFSISRSGSTFLCAMAVGAEVGVDIEIGRADVAASAVMGTALSPEEVAQIELLPVRLRHAAILRQWTRKEAVLKGLGSGLRTPPASLALGVDPTAPLSAAPVRASRRRWHLWDLDVENGAAAVAVEGSSHRLHLIER